MVHRSTTSGSRAALWMMVTPSANTAAIRMFSVAPTDGNSSWISAPRNDSASATTHPCSMLQRAPNWRRPDWCISSGREPIASPPGSATRARLQRPTNGPSTQTEARNCRTAAKSASYFGSSGDVIRTVSPSSSTVAPSPRSTSAINGTSRMSGQFVIVVMPSASKLAAINFRTLFLAPPTATSPDNRLPPVTTNRSLTPVSVVRGSSSVSSRVPVCPSTVCPWLFT